MTININDLTLGQVKELQSLLDHSQSAGSDSHVYVIGKNYLIRTVTMIQVGTLVKVTDKELVLQKAGWIADTGQFSECLEKGTISQIEMFPSQCNVIVGRGALIDACEWINPLPTKTK